MQDRFEQSSNEKIPMSVMPSGRLTETTHWEQRQPERKTFQLSAGFLCSNGEDSESQILVDLDKCPRVQNEIDRPSPRIAYPDGMRLLLNLSPRLLMTTSCSPSKSSTWMQRDSWEDSTRMTVAWQGTVLRGESPK